MPRAPANAATPQPPPPAPQKGSDLSAGWVGGVFPGDPLLASDQQYRSGMNIRIDHGLVRSMMPFRRIATLPTAHPQALASWVDGLGISWLLAVVGGKVYASRSAFAHWFRLTGYEFSPRARQVFHESTVKSVHTDPSGRLRIIKPEQRIFFSDTFRAPAYFNGTELLGTLPSPPHYGPPVGTSVMKWSGDRLWCALQNQLLVSDLGAPDQFIETVFLAGGGSIPFRDRVIGLADPTANSKSGLLVGLARETHLVRSEIRDRTKWQETNDFSIRVFEGIGIVAPKSVASHFGAPNWLSAKGLIGLDEAKRTYSTNSFRPADYAMHENRGRLSPDRTQACSGTYENLLFLSVPAGDIWNRETWVRDVDPGADTPAWAGADIGILPVEWATVTQGGVSRLFCLARESATSPAVHVWEYDPAGGGRAAWGDADWPLCQLELGVLKVAPDFDLRKFFYGKLEVTDIRSDVQLRVYVAPARSRVYRQILEKRIGAGAGVFVRNDGEDDSQTFLIEEQRSQGRSVWTEDLDISDDDVAPIDAPDYSGDPDGRPNLDRGFSLLIEWRGDCAIRSVQAFSDTAVATTRGMLGADEPTRQRSKAQCRLAPTVVASVPANRAPDPTPVEQTSFNP